MLTSTTGGGHNIYKEKYFKNKKIYGIFGKISFSRIQEMKPSNVTIQMVTRNHLGKTSNKNTSLYVKNRFKIQ